MRWPSGAPTADGNAARPNGLMQRAASLPIMPACRLQGHRSLADQRHRAAMTEPPGLDQAKGMLRLKGYFPGQPVQIIFEMLFQTVDGRWRLFGLAVQQSGPAVAAQSAPAAQNAPQSGPAQ